MDIVSHRELRNNSAEVLRRVANGETLQVTNHGSPAAVIGPMGGTVLDCLIARGEARPAPAGMSSLDHIRRRLAGHAAPEASSSEMIKDARGQW